MEKISKISKTIIEIIIIIFILNMVSSVVNDIGSSLNNIEPISIYIELIGTVEDEEFIDDAIKQIDYTIKYAQYKYIDVATNRVYNVISIVGIFFTVFVIVITIYQYLQQKSYEERIESLECELKDNSEKLMIEVDKYNVEAKILINSNITFAKAQNHFMSGNFLKAAQEYEILIEIIDKNKEVSTIYDLNQIKKCAIEAFKLCGERVKALQILKSIVDFSMISLNDKVNFDNYLEYCDLMKNHVLESSEPNELLEVIKLYNNLLASLDEYSLESIEQHEEIKSSLAEVQMKLGKKYYIAKKYSDAEMYLKNAFEILKYQGVTIEQKEFILALNNIYLYNRNNNSPFNFDDFFNNYDRLIFVVGIRKYSDDFLEKETECSLLNYSNLLLKTMNEYAKRFKSEYEELERKMIIRKMFIVFKVHAKDVDEDYYETDTLECIKHAEKLYESDKSMERHIGTNPFEDYEILSII